MNAAWIAEKARDLAHDARRAGVDWRDIRDALGHTATEAHAAHENDVQGVEMPKHDVALVDQHGEVDDKAHRESNANAPTPEA